MHINLTTTEQKDTICALNAHIYRLEQALAPKSQIHPSHDAGRWDFQPLNNDEFVTAVLIAKKLCIALHPRQLGDDYVRHSFLDVGSGIGSKHMLAMSLGYAPVRGIEINSTYIKIASRLYAESSTIVCDAFEYPDYHKWDVIYFYCPVRDQKLQLKLEHKISSECKDGAILIQALKQNEKWTETEPNLHCLNARRDGHTPYTGIYIKTADQWLLTKAHTAYEYITTGGEKC